MIEAGLPLPSRSDRQTDEMLLFYETITAATRRLYLSYPAVDESGEPLTPSPYLKEVQQACGTTPIVRSEQIDLSPVPGEGEVCSFDAFRVRAVADAIQGKAERLAGFLRHCHAVGQADHDHDHDHGYMVPDMVPDMVPGRNSNDSLRPAQIIRRAAEKCRPHTPCAENGTRRVPATLRW